MDLLIHSVGSFEIKNIVGNVWTVLLAFVVMDIVTGILASAAEKKLNSSITYKGMIKKTGMFVALGFLVLLDALFSTDGSIIKVGIGIMLTAEAFSIIENFSRIGIDLSFLTKYFSDEKVKKEESK